MIRYENAKRYFCLHNTDIQFHQTRCRPAGSYPAVHHKINGTKLNTDVTNPAQTLNQVSCCSFSLVPFFPLCLANNLQGFKCLTVQLKKLKQNSVPRCCLLGFFCVFELVSLMHVSVSVNTIIMLSANLHFCLSSYLYSSF